MEQRRTWFLFQSHGKKKTDVCLYCGKKYNCFGLYKHSDINHCNGDKDGCDVVCQDKISRKQHLVSLHSFPKHFSMKHCENPVVRRTNKLSFQSRPKRNKKKKPKNKRKLASLFLSHKFTQTFKISIQTFTNNRRKHATRRQQHHTHHQRHQCTGRWNWFFIRHDERHGAATDSMTACASLNSLNNTRNCAWSASNAIVCCSPV